MKISTVIFEGGNFTVGESRDGRSRVRSQERCNYITLSSNGQVCCRGNWRSSLGGKPHYCVGNAFPTRFCNAYVVTPIMVEGGSKILGVDSAGGSGAMEGGFFMHQYHGAWGRHRSSIEVVEFIEDGVGRKFWFEARGAE